MFVVLGKVFQFLFGGLYTEQAINVWSFRTNLHAASSTEELHSSL